MYRKTLEIIETNRKSTDRQGTLSKLSLISHGVVTVLFMRRKYQTDKYQTDNNKITKTSKTIEITRITQLLYGFQWCTYLLSSSFVSLPFVSLHIGF